MVKNNIFTFFMLLALPLFGETPIAGQYDQEFIDIIHTVYGSNCMSVGGNSSSDKMLTDLTLDNKTVLDFGCETGAPAKYLAEKYNAQVIALDVDDIILEEAKKLFSKSTAKHPIKVVKANSNLLPLEDASIDVVFSREAILHVKNKKELFQEFYRVLKPGGLVVVLDWIHQQPHYTKKMKQLLEIDGLTWHLITSDEYINNLQQAGFKMLRYKDLTTEYAKAAAEDCKKLEDKIGQKIAQQFGEQTLHYCKKSWKLQHEVTKSGELRCCYIRAIK
jgi:ubiquinone/menaquinone biosynthesis C-methylase UbiE